MTAVVVLVLHGLGGVGKTQLTAIYTRRYKNSYSAIFWLNIKGEDYMKQSFAKIAKQILQEHPLANWLNNMNIKRDLDAIIDTVKTWLDFPNNTR